MPEEKALADISEIPGLDGLALTGPNPDTEKALDEFFTGATGEKPPTNPEDEFVISEAARKKAEAEAKLKADAEAEDAEAEAKIKADGGDDAVAQAKAKEEAAAAAAAKAKEEADAKAIEAAKDDFDKIPLPPYSKPKTTDAFETVKKLARDKILVLQKDLEASQAKAKEFETKGNGKLDPAIEKELIELRKFRSKIDVEADPVFKTYDSKVAGNIDSIYAKLKEMSTPEEAIAKIKELGGPENVDWDSVKMGSPLRRFIEQKLANNMELADQKKAALDRAKENATEYLKSRRADFEKSAGDESKVVEAELDALTKEFVWASQKQAASGANETELKSVADHNSLAKDIKEMMSEAINDPSPRMRALLALGTAQFVNLRAEHARLKAAHVIETTGLKKDLEEAQVMLAKVKKSSTNRLRESSATTSHNDPGKTKAEFHEPAGDALDRHLKELQAVPA